MTAIVSSEAETGVVSESPRPMTGPLTGVRIVTLTQAWAGTYATQLMSHLGADVIQIEGRSRPDVWRGTYNARVPSELRSTPTAVHGWNLASAYNSVNLNKRGITLDLAHEVGKSLFMTLVRQADVVAENFSPRVMGNLGLSFEELQTVKPDLILLSMSAYGTFGPYANYPGIGGTIEGMSGMTSLLGYEGGEPLNSGLMYPDPVSGYYGAAAVMLALLHRQKTGKGQHVTLAMQEACANFLADAFVRLADTGEVPQRAGNHHPTYSPHNIFPCAGSEQWIAIAVTTETEFVALMNVLGASDLLGDKRFASAAARKAHEAELDTVIADLTRKHDVGSLRNRLAEARVPSCVVVKPEETFKDPLLHARGTFAPAEHAEAGTHMYPVGPWMFDRHPRGLVRSAPCHGQHSREVLTTMCGVSDEEYNRLVAMGVTGEGPPD